MIMTFLFYFILFKIKNNSASFETSKVFLQQDNYGFFSYNYNNKNIT